jgi:hypothetical protein
MEALLLARKICSRPCVQGTCRFRRRIGRPEEPITPVAGLGPIDLEPDETWADVERAARIMLADVSHRLELGRVAMALSEAMEAPGELAAAGQ